MGLSKLLYVKFRNLRSKLIICFFKSVYGAKFQTEEGLYVRKGFTVTIEENGFISIGRDVFFNNFCSLNALEEIEIGDDCIFGENVHIYDHNHKYSNKSIPVNSQGFTKKKVSVGSNTWVGSNVVILKGVSIGKHCVIGAGCVVFKDVPENHVLVCKQGLMEQRKI